MAAKTIDKMKSALADKGVKAININRLAEIMAEYVTLDAFFEASRGNIMATYNKLHPKTGKGLGDNFFRAYDVALAWWKSPEEPPRPAEMPDVSFSYDSLKKVVDFMDMFDVAEIPLARMLQVIETIDKGQGRGLKLKED